MSRFRATSDRGEVATAAVLTIAGIVLGGVAAVGAAVAVVSEYGPGDGTAVQDGPKDVLPPDQILTYGG